MLYYYTYMVGAHWIINNQNELQISWTEFSYVRRVVLNSS